MAQFKFQIFKTIIPTDQQKEEKNYKAIKGKFNIEDLNGVVEILRPELRIYNQPKIVNTTKPITRSATPIITITIKILNLSIKPSS